MKVRALDHLARGFHHLVMSYVRMTVRFRGIGLLLVAAIARSATAATFIFLPRLEYLPEGNRNLVFGLIIPPPRI